MTAKNYLSRLFYVNKHIKADEEELEMLNTLFFGVKSFSFGERVQGTFKSEDARTAELIDKIDHAKKELLKDIDKFLKIKSEIKGTILKVKDEKIQLLLRYRYIEFLTWEQVSDKLDNYSLQWLHKLHAKGLKEVEEILNSWF